MGISPAQPAPRQKEYGDIIHVLDSKEVLSQTESKESYLESPDVNQSLLGRLRPISEIHD